MGKINILETWKECKSIVKECLAYAENGYSNQNNELMNDIKMYGKQKTVDSLKNKNIDLSKMPKDLLDKLKNTFMQVVCFIQSYLLNSSVAEDALYGLMFINTDVGIDFTIDNIVGYNVKKYPFVIEFNPFYGLDYSINELLGQTEMELMRIIQLHPVTFSKLNPRNDSDKHFHLEVGSSLSASEAFFTSATLSGENNRSKINDSVLCKTDIEELLNTKGIYKDIKSESTLEYYTELSEAFVPIPPQSPGAAGANGNPNSVGGKSSHDWENINEEDTEDKLKESVLEAYNSLTEKQRGELPGGITSRIELLKKKPVENWKQVLRKFIGSIPSGHRPSRTRLNRRQPDRFDLKGTLSDKVVRLVIAIDTSGSMSDDDIAFCLNEIYNIIKSYKTDITVIECDSSIGRVYKINKPTDIKPEVSGRGGTSFTPVIEYINSNRIYRDAVMIYFTDGCGESVIPRPNTYRNLWMVINQNCGNDYISLDNPYGEVKYLYKDESFRKSRGLN